MLQEILSAHHHGHHHQDRGEGSRDQQYMEHFYEQMSESYDEMWQRYNDQDYSQVFDSKIDEFKRRFMQDGASEEDAQRTWMKIFGYRQQEQESEQDGDWISIDKIQGKAAQHVIRELQKIKTAVEHFEGRMDVISHNLDKRLQRAHDKLEKAWIKYEPIVRALLQKFYEDHQEEIDGARDTYLMYYEKYTEMMVSAHLTIPAMAIDKRDQYCAADPEGQNTTVKAIVCSENGQLVANYLAFAATAPAFCKYEHFLKVFKYLVDENAAKEHGEKVLADVTQMVQTGRDYANALY